MRMIANRIGALLADKGDDADTIRQEFDDAELETAIPAKRNRLNPAPHDQVNYRWRDRIERLQQAQELAASPLAHPSASTGRLSTLSLLAEHESDRASLSKWVLILAMSARTDERIACLPISSHRCSTATYTGQSVSRNCSRSASDPQAHIQWDRCEQRSTSPSERAAAGRLQCQFVVTCTVRSR
jgi:hypothetical protein